MYNSARVLRNIYRELPTCDNSSHAAQKHNTVTPTLNAQRLGATFRSQITLLLNAIGLTSTNVLHVISDFPAVYERRLLYVEISIYLHHQQIVHIFQFNSCNFKNVTKKKRIRNFANFILHFYTERNAQMSIPKIQNHAFFHPPTTARSICDRHGSFLTPKVSAIHFMVQRLLSKY
jgi:hypothetical protein